MNGARRGEVILDIKIGNIDVEFQAACINLQVRRLRELAGKLSPEASKRLAAALDEWVDALSTLVIDAATAAESGGEAGLLTVMRRLEEECPDPLAEG